MKATVYRYNAKVLILIAVEDTLGAGLNGLDKLDLGVLILIAVEDTLGDEPATDFIQDKNVLILIAVEDTLGAEKKCIEDIPKSKVLILIAVEDTLGVDVVYNKPYGLISLNPYCCGRYARSNRIKNTRGCFM